MSHFYDCVKWGILVKFINVVNSIVKLIIHKENTKEIISVKASVYAIQILVDLHKL